MLLFEVPDSPPAVPVSKTTLFELVLATVPKISSAVDTPRRLPDTMLLYTATPPEAMDRKPPVPVLLLSESARLSVAVTPVSVIAPPA